MRILRHRRIAFVVACIALVTMYVTWWTSYAETHQKTRFSQLAPGRAAEFPEGTIRVVSLSVADELTSPQGGDPAVADPDAVWVVAVVEVVTSRASDRIWCGLELLATDGRVWEKGGPYFERTLPRCDEREMTTGQPYRFEAIFLAPRLEADSLAGLVLNDHSTAARAPVITPP